MIKKGIYIRKNRVTVSLFLVIMGVVLILVSELSRYTGESTSSIISGIQKTIIYAIILLGFFLACTKKHSQMEKAGELLLAFSLITVISTFFGVTPDIPFWRQAIHLMLFVSVFWTVYIATEQFKLEGCIGILIFAYILVVSVYCIAIITQKKIDGNVVYYLLLFLPLTSMIKSNTLKKVLYVLQIFAVLVSNKRTALIVVVMYLLCDEWMSNKRVVGKKKIWKGIIYIVIIIALYIAFPLISQKLNITVFNELELSNITEDGGSNRLYIYGQLWMTQKNSSLLHWGIGSGYNSVLLSKICTDGPLGEAVSGHNDFLEVLYDYGVIGLMLYISFLVSIIKKAIKMKKNQYRYAVPFMGSILIVVFMSLTSHLVIYLNYYAVMFAFWALCLADYRYGGKYD